MGLNRFYFKLWYNHTMPKYGKYHTKPQDKRFVKEFIKTGNATQSAVVAYTKNRTSASAIGHRKLKMGNIQAMIQQAMVDEDLDPAYTIHQRKVLVETGMSQLKDNKVTPADILKSLDGLEKLMGITGSTQSFQSHLHLHQAPLQDVVDYRSKQGKYFDQIKK
jgi:hypothetical protein